MYIFKIIHYEILRTTRHYDLNSTYSSVYTGCPKSVYIISHAHTYTLGYPTHRAVCMHTSVPTY